MIRNSLAFISWNDRKSILPWIKAIYRTETADIALVRLEEFEAEWAQRYPAIGQAWRRVRGPLYFFDPCPHVRFHPSNHCIWQRCSRGRRLHRRAEGQTASG